MDLLDYYLLFACYDADTDSDRCRCHADLDDVTGTDLADFAHLQRQFGS